MSNLQIIAALEELTEVQARVIKSLACRLAELGDLETGRDEIAEADRKFREVIGGDEWPDFLLPDEKIEETYGGKRK